MILRSVASMLWNLRTRELLRPCRAAVQGWTMCAMQRITHDPSSIPPSVGGYAQGVEIVAPQRQLFISGQIPEDVDVDVALGFEEQCRQAWRNVVAVPASAGMTVEDLVKVTTYLTVRDHAEPNGSIRRDFLADARPALTVVVADTLLPQWLLEVEAVAAC